MQTDSELFIQSIVPARKKSLINVLQEVYRTISNNIFATCLYGLPPS